MPWLINEKGEFEYKTRETRFNTPLTESEKHDKSFYESFLCMFDRAAKNLEQFLEKECLKSITFDIANPDGTKEQKTLSEEETRNWLSKNTDVFREAGREPVTHFLAFALKNGITMDELYLLRDHPQDPACQNIRNNLEQSRKEMFEFVGSKDSRVLNEGGLSVREEKLVNFFTDYLVKMGKHLDDIKKSSMPNSEKTLAFVNTFREYQSLTVQSIGTGAKSFTREGQLDGKKLVPIINQRLSEKGVKYNFDNISDLGRVAQFVNQASHNLGVSFDIKRDEEDVEIYRNYMFVDTSKASVAISYLNDNLWNSSKSTDEILSSFDGEKMSNLLAEYVEVQMYDPRNAKDKDSIKAIQRYEDMLSDIYLDEKFSKFQDQTVSANFENELHSLSDSFGNQSNPNDPDFNEMTKGLSNLSKVYKDPKSSPELKLNALRYAQKKAAYYLDSHESDLTSKTPRNATLLAEKIFTLTGTQKTALKKGLSAGEVIKGQGQYKHDFSNDAINRIVPVKIESKLLKSNRYKTIAQKHVNAGDVLPDAKKHIQKETSADYSKIDKIKDKNNVVVHSGLGKKNRLEGGYNLEFVCAGSSNIQMAKTYKGQTGRNELGKMQLKDDPAAKEIVDNIKAKYNITFEGKEGGDNSKFEFAVEQDYGKPMYLDQNKELSENSSATNRIMPGIRKQEKGTTTRYNISGAMGKLLNTFGDEGLSNSGDYSIENNKEYMIGLADKWLTGVNEEYQGKIAEGKASELKPINIMFKGHSRGGVAANEASQMVNHLVETKYPQLREYVHISTHLLDPVPGLGSNREHPETDLNKGNYQLNGKDLRGLKASSIERKNNSSTVFYSIHSNHKGGFAPQSIKGVDRFIMSCMAHDSGIFDSVNGHKRGYLAENGQEYRGSGFDELDKGLYFIDEDKNIVSCKNSQEAHKAIDAMLGKKGRFSSQWTRHNRMHDMVDAWYKSHPEVITSKDTRYPVEQAMQEDRNALKTVLNSFDHTNPNTELAADPNEVLTRGISSMFAHQILLDKMKGNKERIYPKTAEDTKKLLAESEKSGLADRIRKSDDFKLFYDGLNKEDIQILASGNPGKVKSYLNNYKAIINLSKDGKIQVRNENLTRRSENQVGRKDMFFEKHVNAKGEWQPRIQNRVNLSADRTALNMIAVSRLMQEGKSLKDIMDPFKLERERQAMGEKVLRDYATMDDNKLAESASGDILYGFEHSLDEMDAVVGKLDNLSVEELSKPENAYILRCRDLITNFGQELGSKGNPIFDKALESTSTEHIENLFKRQVTSNLVMGRIEEAQTEVNKMINHPNEYENPDIALTNVGGAVFTVMGLGSRFKELKEQHKENFKFSEAFGSIKETDIEVCKATFQGTELYRRLKESIVKEDNEEVLDTEKFQKLGKEFQSGKIFDGQINISKSGMGFDPIENVEGLVESFNQKPVENSPENEQKAFEVYNTSRRNINGYEKREKLASKLSEMKSKSLKDISLAGKGLNKLADEGLNLSDKEFEAQKASLLGKIYDGLAGMIYSGIVDENCKKNGEYDEKALSSSLDQETVDAQKKSISENIEKLAKNGSIGKLLNEVNQASADGNLSKWYMDKVNNPQSEINKQINKDELKASSDAPALN